MWDWHVCFLCRANDSKSVHIAIERNYLDKISSISRGYDRERVTLLLKIMMAVYKRDSRK